MQMAIKIAELECKKLPELQKLWSEYYQEIPTSQNKEFYISRIAYRMQELEYGGLSTSLKRMLLKTDVKKSIDKTSKLPPVGTRLLKNYKGQEYCVKVMINGFEFNGMKYNSISAIALAITGKRISGYRFFKLDGGDDE